MENEDKKVIDIGEVRRRQKVLNRGDRRQGKSVQKSEQGLDVRSKLIVAVQLILFLGIIAYFMTRCGR
jgi:hypothetical protein